MFIFTVGRIIAIVMLLGASDKGPLDYPTLGLIVCAVALYGFWRAYKTGKKAWLVSFGIIAVIFNPLFPVQLAPAAWAGVNIGTAVLFISSLVLFRLYVRRLKEKKRERITVLPSGEIMKDAEFEVKDDATAGNNRIE